MTVSYLAAKIIKPPSSTEMFHTHSSGDVHTHTHTHMHTYTVSPIDKETQRNRKIYTERHKNKETGTDFINIKVCL